MSKRQAPFVYFYIVFLRKLIYNQNIPHPSFPSHIEGWVFPFRGQKGCVKANRSVFLEALRNFQFTPHANPPARPSRAGNFARPTRITHFIFYIISFFPMFSQTLTNTDNSEIQFSDQMCCLILKP